MSLTGYHKCSREDSARLAALIYRVRHGENKQELQSVPQLLRELVPADLTKAHSSSEWKRNIVAAYNQDAGTARLREARPYVTTLPVGCLPTGASPLSIYRLSLLFIMNGRSFVSLGRPQQSWLRLSLPVIVHTAVCVHTVSFTGDSPHRCVRALTTLCALILFLFEYFDTYCVRALL